MILAGQHTPRRRWRIAFLLALGVLVNFFDRINLSVSRDALHDSFGLSLVAFGYLSSAFSWTYALMQMPCGVLLDRWGVRRVSRASALLWSASSFAAALAPGLSWFAGARLLLGVSESPTFPANAKALGYWFTRDERGLATAITDAAAFLSGYGVRLLTVVQALSQLDALYGAKESRTFATNHGLQILFAPREQRDAEEYSAMLGQYTQRATSFGRSRSHGLNGHGACSRHDSDQRRALLLPQEFKELGPERLVVILEHCKPILAQKIRYHRDPVFTSRLRPAPLVPPLDIDRHLARVQLSARGASDDAPAGQGIENAVRTCRTCGPAQLSQGLPPQVWPDQASNTLQGFFPGAGPDLDGARREDPGRAHSPSASPETSDAALTRSVASS